ncbi:MAG TPA: polyprenyl diphosphate synthase [Desulfomonilia bacterium]|nr:polyprenyl diphosphate synthase [Desulfomonilia bacterium]
MQNKIDHLAIIMDGNGRWAQKKGLPRLKGHEMGARTALKIVEAAKERSVKYLTLYAFSSENWSRPKEEVEGLFNLLDRFIAEEVKRLKSSGVCIHIIGDMSRFSQRLQDKIRMTLDLTKDNTDLHLAIALNYGGRDEILRAVRKLMEHDTAPEDIDEKVFGEQLDTSFMPDPDLLVRTGGEWRVSNFLLWQLAYTEIYFTEILWPDFDEAALDKAIAWFTARQRRFGMTGEQIKEQLR